MIIRNARILTFDRKNRVIDCGAVEVREDGALGWIGEDAKLPESLLKEEAFDGDRKLLMPALINCHTHLYSSLARGISLRGAPPRNFIEILKKLWWKLDVALDDEDVYLSAMVGLIESAKAGVATLFDHHSSPNACPGSLDVIEEAFRDVGLRGCLCYETSDRNGRASAREAITENARFIEHAGSPDDQNTIAASFGLHASFTLGDRTLQECLSANKSLGGRFHIHLAEDRADVELSRVHSGKSPVRRLYDFGVLNAGSIAAHCVHVSKADVALLAKSGVNVVHNAQSNCNNAVGTANLSQLLDSKVAVGLGSDGYSPRMLDEFATAFHVQKVRACDPRAGYSEVFTAHLNNREVARRICNWNIGAIETGSRADLMMVDYYPPTPLTADNLFGHILFGISRAPVSSLWVNGKLVVRDGHCVNVNERAIYEKAAIRSRTMWSRM
ncbi:MAG TPA: putative aminohydrolase SsnA [Terriglobales bacterium]